MNLLVTSKEFCTGRARLSGTLQLLYKQVVCMRFNLLESRHETRYSQSMLSTIPSNMSVYLWHERLQAQSPRCLGRQLRQLLAQTPISSARPYPAQSTSNSVALLSKCSLMSGEWQVATRNRRRGAKQPAFQLSPCAAVITDHPQKQDCAYTPTSAHERLPAPQPAEGNDALISLQKQIEARSKEVINSSFLLSFQRLLEYVQHQELLDTTTGQCSLKNRFQWEAATELIVYGLGSPAAGNGFLCCLPRAPETSCAGIC